jgi:hypothetical protein
MQVATFVIPAGNNFKTAEFEEYVAGQELVKVSFWTISIGSNELIVSLTYPADLVSCWQFEAAWLNY